MKIISFLREKYLLIVFILGVLFIGVFAFFASPVVISDGYCYYHIARSIVDKGNFVSDTKPDYIDYRGHVISYTDGVYKDVCSPGTSFAIVPGLFISKQFKSPSINQYNDYFMAYSGHYIGDGIAILLTALTFGVVSLIYLYKLSKIVCKRRGYAVLLTASVFLSSYVINYVFVKPFYTHIYEFFAGVIFLYNIVKFQKGGTFKNLMVAGLVVGFGFSVRPFFAIVSALFFVWLLWKKNWKGAIWFAIWNLPFVLLTFAYNYVSFGKFIASGYQEIRGENFNFGNSNIIPLFLSPWKGWFVWSPVFLAAFFGYFLKIIHKKLVFVDFLSIFMVLVTALMYSFWPAWWGGGSYGARFMIINAPFMIFGLGYLFNYSMSKRKRIILLVFCILSIIFSSVFSLMYLIAPNFSPKGMVMYYVNNLSELSKEPINFMLDSRYIVDSEFGFGDFLLGRTKSVIKIDDRKAGEVGLLGFDSVPGQKDIPVSVEFYMRNTINGFTEKFSANISELSKLKKLSLVLHCTKEKCISESPAIATLGTEQSDRKFISGEFNMFRLENNPYKVFIKKDIMLKIVGPNLAGPSDSGYYE